MFELTVIFKSRTFRVLSRRCGGSVYVCTVKEKAGMMHAFAQLMLGASSQLCFVDRLRNHISKALTSLLIMQDSVMPKAN